MPQRQVEVGYVTLSTEPVTLTSELTGRTTATKTAEVRPQVDGLIKAQLFEEGSIVKAGQPLYQLDSRLYTASRDQTLAQLESAKATAATADAKVARYQRLESADAVAKQDLDDAIATSREARASIAQYQAALQTANINLGFTQITAPISGRIGRSTYTQGALVNAQQSTALATIQQIDPIYVDIQQSAADLLNLRDHLASGDQTKGDASVKLRLDNGTIYPLTGKIEFAESSVNETTGMVTVRAKFANPNGILLPGMFVRVEAAQSVVQNGRLAPQQGITRDSRGGATALVVDASGKVALRQVTVTQVIGNKWLVSAGLNAGDRLIVEGTDKVRAGDSVKAVATQLSE
ncbi:efflux RND transporter periplasmic adaptor subunit [Asticcacaulis sp. 201]|uniref:efflux RND transporter periplasmic adaptor subunit n=1 Tax=Asticcacaulis sp. 201 TaxID=3028787 RepID=UPI0029162D2F|nr:efflux RND transporter periplasmic adaptor subunit [Asticcacaulis sp. 201]MDV6331161.1 efflux RND transporter periplasmic adaptor subunit [Asticcacaulis sp. 201]